MFSSQVYLLYPAKFVHKLHEHRIPVFRHRTKVLWLLLLGSAWTISGFAQQSGAGRDLPSPKPHIYRSLRSSSRTQRTALDGRKTVRFVYLVPADSVIKPYYTLAIKNAARQLQQWYSDQLGDNLSFSLTGDIVEVRQSTHPSSWYSTNPDADWAGEWKFWFNAVNDAFSLTGGSFEDPDNFWIVYVDAFPVCPQRSGGGLNQVASMDANDLRGLIGQRSIPPCNEVWPDYTSCRYVGGLGHELGHAFGLPHPPGCDDGQAVACDYSALMYLGYIDYPNTYFSPSEKATLRASPFIGRMDASYCPIDCGLLNHDYSIASSQAVSVCYGEAYFAGGKLQTTSGTYTDKLHAKNGCDSIVTTNLTVLPPFASSQSVALCDGESFFVAGALHTTSGTFTEIMRSRNGCDSTVTTRLDFFPTYSATKEIFICQGETYFAGGDFQSASGTYIDTFVTRNGCDSLVVTRLNVAPDYKVNIDASICAGDSYVVGGIPRTISGVYEENHVTRLGCDSVLVIKLTVQEQLRYTRMVTICAGESYLAGGCQQQQSGTYTDVLTASHGCDSVIVTHLTVLPEKIQTRTVTICEDDSYFAGGSMQSESGVYRDVFATAGCDSVLVTQLEVIPRIEVLKQVSTCKGTGYYAGGALQTTSGTYRDVYPSVAGCDSVVTVQLTVQTSYESIIDINTCEGEPYFAAGALQTVSGIYTDVFTSKGGCDSLIVTNLTVGICTAVAPSTETVVSVYPVPTQSCVYIESVKFHHAVLVDRIGRYILSTNESCVNLDGFPGGTYYVKIFEDAGQKFVTRKVILAR